MVPSAFILKQVKIGKSRLYLMRALPISKGAFTSLSSAEAPAGLGAGEKEKERVVDDGNPEVRKL